MPVPQLLQAVPLAVVLEPAILGQTVVLLRLVPAGAVASRFQLSFCGGWQISHQALPGCYDLLDPVRWCILC